MSRRAPSEFALAALLSLSMACGGASKKDTPQEPAAETRTLHGAFKAGHWLDIGDPVTANAPQPADTDVVALVLDGSSAGYRALPGSIAADGTFTVPDVPVGTYFLQVTRGSSVGVTELTTSTPVCPRRSPRPGPTSPTPHS
jgi:hypothetical protein